MNSISVINESILSDAAKSDERRANGEPRGLLEGISFTVKNSFKVKGMTAASGSPAFKGLVANEDAFTVRMLEAGAILIGKTNSHPWRRAVCREDSTVEQEVSTTQST